MTEQFANLAQTSLASSITATQTTFNVVSAALFPSTGNFRIVVQSFDPITGNAISQPEIMLVTAVSGNQFTVQRAAETSGFFPAIAFASGATVANILTAAVMNALESGTGVSSLNTLTGAITLAAGTNTTITPSGNTLTISSTGSGGGTPGGTSGQIQYNNAGSFGGFGTYSGTTVALGTVTLSTAEIISPIITTSATSFTASQTGDQFGGSSFVLQNRVGLNGFQVQNPTLDLADMGALTSTGAQGNMRFEHRSSQMNNAGNATFGEYQVFLNAGVGNGNVAAYFGLAACGTIASMSFPSAVVGSPTGGNEGTGTLNAQGLYVNGVAVNAAANVSSVSNSDGSLTISPTVGAIVASLNTAHANTFSATQTFSTVTATTYTGVTINLTGAGTVGSLLFNTAGPASSTAVGGRLVFDSANFNTWVSAGNSANLIFGTGSLTAGGLPSTALAALGASGGFNLTTGPYEVGGIPIPGVLASVTGINGLATGSTLLYTNATGGMLLISDVALLVTAATAATGGPTVQIGTTTTGSDVYASIAITALTATNAIYHFGGPGMSKVIPNGGSLYMDITNAGAGTTLTLRALVLGAFI